MPTDTLVRSMASSRRRLFVIEDDEVCGATLQMLLSEDHEVQEIPSVPEALNVGQNQPPDAILLGVGVLIHQGPAILQDLRSAWPSVKTMVVCDTADDEEIEACLAQGADAALPRPINMDAVREAMGRLFGRLKVRNPNLLR